LATSVHDHYIRRIEVDAVDRTLRLCTGYPQSKGPEFVDVEFEQVEAYVFSGDALGTILFDIEPVDALTLYREYASEMQRVEASSGGHPPWTRSEAAAAEFLSSKDVRGYRVSSSIGLEGAVWAQQMSVSAVDRAQE
jgi:hypothetical protein